MSQKNRYQQLKNELDSIISQLQDEQLDIDSSLELYDQGQKVISQLEKYLALSKAKIDKKTKK